MLDAIPHDMLFSLTEYLSPEDVFDIALSSKTLLYAYGSHERGQRYWRVHAPAYITLSNGDQDPFDTIRVESMSYYQTLRKVFFTVGTDWQLDFVGSVQKNVLRKIRFLTAEMLRQDHSITRLIRGAKDNMFSGQYHILAKILRMFYPNSMMQFSTILQEKLMADHDHFEMLVCSFPQIFKRFFIDGQYARDREKVLLAVTNHGILLGGVAQEFRTDREIVLSAVKNDGSALIYADISLQKDKEVILEAVRQNAAVFGSLPKDMQRDEEVILETAKKNAAVFWSTSEICLRNKKILKVVLERLGGMLRMTDEKTKRDPELVLAATKSVGFHAILSAGIPDTFKKDKDFALNVLRVRGCDIRFFDHSLAQDVDVVLAAVRGGGYDVLRYVDQEFANKREVVLELVRFHGKDIQYLDAKYTSDKEVVLAAIYSDAWAFKYASQELQADPEILIAYLKKRYSEMFEYAGEHNSESVIEFISKNM